MYQVAILGGTYSPPTRAHFAMAVAALNHTHFDIIYIIPNKASVLKETTASTTDRLNMLTLALQHDPQLHGIRDKFEINRCEIDRETKSYMYTTLKQLHETLQKEHEDYRISLIVGWDSLLEFTRWYRWQDLLDLCHLVVVSRPGYCESPPPPELRGRFSEIFLDLDISSTEVRRRLTAGESTEGLIEPVVRDYIEEKGLYLDPSLGMLP